MCHLKCLFSERHERGELEDDLPNERPKRDVLGVAGEASPRAPLDLRHLDLLEYFQFQMNRVLLTMAD